MHSFEFFFLFGVIIVSFGTRYLLCKLSASKLHQHAAATCCFSASSPTTSDRHPHSLLLPHLPSALPSSTAASTSAWPTARPRPPSPPPTRRSRRWRTSGRARCPTWSTTKPSWTTPARTPAPRRARTSSATARTPSTTAPPGSSWWEGWWSAVVSHPPLTPPHHTHCDTGWDGRSGADGGLLRGRRCDWNTGNKVRKPWNFFLFLPLKAMIGIREESSKSGQEESGVPHLSWSVISERFFALPPTAVITHRIHPNWWNTVHRSKVINVFGGLSL